MQFRNVLPRLGSLGLRVTVSLLAVAVIPLLTYMVLNSVVVAENFLNLEKQSIKTKTEKVSMVLMAKTGELDKIARGFGVSNETYSHIQRKDRDWFADNITVWMPDNYNIDLVLIASTQKEVIDQYGLQGGSPAELLDDAAIATLLSGSYKESNYFPSGIKRFNGELYLIASSPILMNHYKGTSQGVIILGKKLSPAFLEDIKKQFGYDVFIGFGDKLVFTPNSGWVLNQVGVPFQSHTGQAIIEPTFVIGTRPLHDISGEEAGRLCVIDSRAMFSSTVGLVRKNGYVALGLSLAIIGLLSLRLRQSIVNPITGLESQIHAMRRKNAIGLVEVGGKGEIRRLAEAFNEMSLSLQNQTEQRNRAEVALRRSEIQLHSITDNMLDMVSLVDMDGTYRYTSPSYKKSLGYETAELQGTSCFELVHPDDRDRLQELFFNLLNSRISQKAVFRYRHKEGHYLWFEAVGNIIAEEEEGRVDGVIISARDITERKTLEKEMMRLQQLNMVGEVAAGIGHEIRNPLTTTRGFLQLLSGKDEVKRYKEYFDLMIDELDRANAIITEFLSMAKDKRINPKPQNLSHILDQMASLIKADALVKDKTVELQLDEVPDLLLDEKEIRQLILNLVRNGLEAMSPGSELTISTFRDGEEVVLCVRDQGTGIRAEVLEKLGTPFFTTKDEGTGLGLAICYSIAARHNAAITVETGLQGTAFFVRFKTAAERPLF